MCPPVDGPTCIGSGDPHYASWDGRRFDFHGTCEYALAQFCGSTDVVISGNNDQCAPGSAVSCLRGARITSRNSNPREIYIEQGSKYTLMVFYNHLSVRYILVVVILIYGELVEVCI